MNNLHRNIVNRFQKNYVVDIVSQQIEKKLTYVIKCLYTFMVCDEEMSSNLKKDLKRKKFIIKQSS